LVSRGIRRMDEIHSGSWLIRKLAKHKSRVISHAQRAASKRRGLARGSAVDEDRRAARVLESDCEKHGKNGAGSECDGL